MNRLLTLIGLLLFLGNGLQAQQTSFEFLDHRSNWNWLGAAQETAEGILYVANNSEAPMTTLNLVSGNCEVTTIYESGFSVASSSIQALDDDTYVVSLINLVDYDIVLGGLIGVIVQNGEVIEVEENLNPFISNDFELSSVETVWLDTLNRWIIETRSQGLYMYESELEPMGIDEKIFLNQDGDWFLYTDEELSYYDGVSSRQLLDNQEISALKRGGDSNYLLSPDSLYRYDDQFTELQDSWALTEAEMSFAQILFTDSEVTFLVDEPQRFSIFRINDAGESEESYDKVESETLALFSSEGDSTLVLSGSFAYGAGRHLFFREFSLYEEDTYDRVDISLDEYSITYDSTGFRTSPMGDTTFFNFYKVNIEVTNHQDRTIAELGSYSRNYTWDLGPFNQFISMNLDGNLDPFASQSDCYLIDDECGIVDENLELHLTGADFKFNMSNERSQTPDFTANVSSISDLNIRIFPNPFTDYLTIESSDDFHSWCLFDMSGRLIYVSTDLTPLSSIAELEGGSYLFQVLTLDGKLHNEIVVKI